MDRNHLTGSSGSNSRPPLLRENCLSAAVNMEKKLRLLVLGASRTGKTQLMSRFMGKEYSDTYMPAVEEYFCIKYTIRGRTYLLDIVETSGMNTNSINQNITLMTGDVYLIVYSVDNAASFETAKELAFMVEQSVTTLANESKHNVSGIRHWNCKRKSPLSTPIIIAGNKLDLDNDRQVQLEDVTNWIHGSRGEFSHTRLIHMEVSAKDLSSVKRLFEMVFSSAHLPIEMSPTMHRKVSETTFVKNTSKVQQKQRQEHHSPKFFRPWKTSSESANLSGSNPSISSDSSDQSETPMDTTHTSEAFATVCFDHRRPSAATEVLLAMHKAKSTHHGHYLPKETFAPLQKLKKKLNRVTSSHI